ncbi:anoctamin-5 [Planococcus citri]|uniref:anoctamin-5 n=1 Tax=Planococcus citri TaxID=170843 RepID=UPI0031F944D2
MSRDCNKDKTYPGSEDEYEEISSAESTAITNELFPHQRSVHFILDERVSIEERQTFPLVEPDNPSFLAPIIRISRASIDETATFTETSSVENNEPVDINHNDKNFLHPNANIHSNGGSDSRKSSAKSRPKTPPSFEELTGGLSPMASKDKKNTLFFNDGFRRIDLVMVYEDENINKGVLNEQENERMENRKSFQESLIREGLELEIEDRENSYDQKTVFIKIHTPYDVLMKYSTALHMKRPVKALISISAESWEEDGNEEAEAPFEAESSFCAPISRWFLLDSSLINEDPTEAAVLTKDSGDKLLVKDREKYFTSAQRTQIAWHILMRARYGDENDVGIRKLLNNKSYISAFPLHEGRYDKAADIDYVYDRRVLYLEWARPGKWFQHQPLWLIRKYFGDKIALYFAWLGFYTNMLILPSIVGLCCFIYGLVTMNSAENTPSKEICDPNIGGNITLCPLCDRTCKYQKLGDSCLFSNMTYLFDNNSTVFFSVFMSFWATSFLEMWKRKQAIITWQWDLNTGIEDEETRPEYDLAASKSFKINPVTRRKEPYIQTWKKFVRFAISVTVVTFMIFVVICAVIITIIVRMTTFAWIGDRDFVLIKRHAKLLTSILAAIINLIMIVILTRIYHHVAIWLTNEENPKTPNDYERSFVVKIFLFEFMNYYSSLIYIAFFKGRFFTHPGDSDSRNSLLLKLKGDVCDPAGCLSELCIQLAIIMIGKQWFSNLLELGFPAIRNWWRKRIHRSAKKNPNQEYTHWEENYNLQDPGKLALFDEYLEMVIQYGFVTLFVAAFPLAPLFALLNNICEIRLDAYKMVAQARRPLAERVEDIGAWYSILRVITYCAVVFNAFVIAYTSDYIPRKIYQHFYSENNNLVGYIDSSLSAFNTSHFSSDDDKLGKGIDNEPEICQYRGYRYGPEHEDAYGLSLQYWIIFGARLVFVVIFEHFVFSVTGILANVIPNMPYQVARQIQLEKLLLENQNYLKNPSSTSGEEMDDYDKLLTELREAHNSAQIGEVVRRGTWARKLSRRISNVSYTMYSNNHEGHRNTIKNID